MFGGPKIHFLPVRLWQDGRLTLPDYLNASAPFTGFFYTAHGEHVEMHACTRHQILSPDRRTMALTLPIRTLQE